MKHTQYQIPNIIIAYRPAINQSGLNINQKIFMCPHQKIIIFQFQLFVNRQPVGGHEKKIIK